MKRLKIFLIFVIIIGFANSCKRKDIELVEKGKVLFLEENYTDAIPYFTKAISRNTLNDEAHAYRGYCQYMLENYTDALVDFSNALQHNPKNGTALFGQACIRWNLEDYVRAYKEFDFLIQINPNHEKAYYYRGRAFIHFGDTISGLKDLSIAMEKDSCFIDTYYLLASVKNKQNQFAEAEEFLEKALKCKQLSN